MQREFTQVPVGPELPLAHLINFTFVNALLVDKNTTVTLDVDFYNQIVDEYTFGHDMSQLPASWLQSNEMLAVIDDIYTETNVVPLELIAIVQHSFS